MAPSPRRPATGRGCCTSSATDWPEEPWLSHWLAEHGNGVKISRRQLATGELAEPLRALLDQPARPPLPPTGVVEAADWLERLLR